MEIKRFSKIDKFDMPNLNDIVNQSYEIGKAWAKACALYNRMENGKDFMISTLIEKIRKEVPPPNGKKFWTRDELKDMARSTKEWDDYMTKLSDANELMLDMSNEKYTLQSAFEAVRSTMANERELNKVR